MVEHSPQIIASEEKPQALQETEWILRPFVLLCMVRLIGKLILHTQWYIPQQAEINILLEIQACFCICYTFCHFFHLYLLTVLGIIIFTCCLYSFLVVLWTFTRIFLIKLYASLFFLSFTICVTLPFNFATRCIKMRATCQQLVVFMP